MELSFHPISANKKMVVTMKSTTAQWRDTEQIDNLRQLHKSRLGTSALAIARTSRSDALTCFPLIIRREEALDAHVDEGMTINLQLDEFLARATTLKKEN